jgi:ankyrin repeat protein
MVNQLTVLLFLCGVFFTVSLTAQEDELSTIFQADDLRAFQQLEKSSFGQPDLFERSLNNGARNIATFLIEQGANVNMHFEGGMTPLITAVNADQPEMVAMLLTSGADPQLKQDQGLEGTPLMYASAKNDTLIPAMLVRAGADVNSVDVNLDPALNWATYYGNVATMQWLIDAGADLSLKSKHGTAVDVGLRLWHADSVMEVFRHTTINQPMTKVEKKLFAAVQAGDTKAAARWLINAAAANTRDGLGTPLLQLAAQKGDVEMVRLLLAKGADPDQMNRVGMVPLAFAARFGHTACVELLLDAGADANMTGEQYQLTALMGAAVNGDVGIAQRLRAAGAGFATIDQINKGSALMWALFYQHEDLAIWMLENGADHQEQVLDGAYNIQSLAEAAGADRVVAWVKRKLAAENPLLGSWQVKEIHYIRADTTIKVSPVHQGRITFSDSHYHLLYNPWINARTPFENLSQPTKDEMTMAFQTLVFNSGSYVYTDSTVTTTSDIARVPGFEGGIQYYRYQLDGEMLELTMFDETYPDGGKPDWYQKLKVMFKLAKE